MSPSVKRLVRQQHRSAGATALIVLTLALALGANAAVLSVADALLLRAVPFVAADRLVAITTAFPGIRLTGMGLSGPESLELGDLTRAFSAAGPYAFTGLVVQGGTEAELASGMIVSRGAVDALRFGPVAGRLFHEQEYLPGGPSAALLGHGLWTRAFGADPAIIGTVVQLGRTAREIVGILPEGLTLMNRPIDVLLPLTLTRDTAGSRTDHGYSVVARLRDDVGLGAAQDDIRRAMDVWRDETGELHVPTVSMHPLEIEPFTRATTGVNREPIAALAAAVVFVLLIACANISNLLVARAERRRADLAVQLALGATRRRLLAESLIEGVALASAGCLGGLLLAHLILDLLKATWPAVADVRLSLDYRVVGLTAVLTIATGLLIGAIPVLRLNLGRAQDWLKSGGRGAAGGPGRLRLQRGLIAVQIALAVLLSASAGLMVRSLLTLTSIDSGIRADGVVRAQISLPSGGYAEDAQVWSFYDRLLERLRNIPSVTGAAVMSGLPPQRRPNNTSFLLDGTETFDHSSIHQVEFVQHVSPDYLSTMGIRLLEGRALTAADDERAMPAALVNQTLAKRFWPNDSAIGHRLKPGGEIGTWFTVVGVVSDVRQDGMQAPVGSELYVPHRQARLLMSGFMPRTMNIVVRAAGDLSPLTAALGGAVRDLDASAAVSGIAPMQEILDRTIAQPRLLAWTFAAFAALALLVAAVGVYAVTACAVSTRTSEFGVRMALGARPRDLFRLVIRSGAVTIAIGIAAGGAASLATARLLRNLLFGIEPADPLTLTIAAAVIGLTAVLATVLPARRAARVDPLTALRD
jgi:predicted permease